MIILKDLGGKRMRKEFITNRQGAKIFVNVDNQPKLVIPVLNHNKNRGLVVEVLSVDFHEEDNTPMVTVRKNKTVNAYLLPDWYRDWAKINAVPLNSQTTPYPCKIEFGHIPDEERYYAEIL